jgi:hypothetical protein
MPRMLDCILCSVRVRDGVRVRVRVRVRVSARVRVGQEEGEVEK